MQFPLNQPVRISDQVLSQEIHGETVLLDLSGEKYFGLDVVGTRVWQLLGEAKLGDEVLTTMLEEYEVTREQLEEDLIQLLGRLFQAGLIQLEAD